MREEGFITAAQERRQARAPARSGRIRARSIARAGYAKEYLRQQFPRSVRRRPSARLGGAHDVRAGTAGDRPSAPSSDGLRRFGEPELQAALVAIDPATGDILALVGGRDFRQSQFNRATRSRRQPGSAFKPLLYAAALEHGYSPVSVLEGLANIAPQGPEEWAPRNASGETPDALTLRAALLESNNRAATALQQRIGSRPVLRLASDVGLRTCPTCRRCRSAPGLVTPLDLTAAFAVFPNGGSAVRPRGIIRVAGRRWRRGARERRSDRARHLAADAPFRWCRCSATSSIAAPASAARQWGVRFPAGGKTGTTDDFKDAWFVGFSSSVVVGVWVGFDQPQDDRPRSYGSRYALPIWSDFMRQAVATSRPAQPFEVPRGLQRRAAVPHLLPASGRRLPDLQRVLQGGGRRPRPAVHAAPGQRQAARAPRGRGFLLGSRQEDRPDLPLTASTSSKP